MNIKGHALERSSAEVKYVATVPGGTLTFGSEGMNCRKLFDPKKRDSLLFFKYKRYDVLAFLFFILFYSLKLILDR